MANRTGDYLKRYRNDDPVTGIGYKIIYNRPHGKYEIYTQYPYNGKNLRNKIRTPEVIKREHDLDLLIDYIENTIIKNHIRFFKKGVFDKELGTMADLEKIASDGKADDKPKESLATAETPKVQEQMQIEPVLPAEDAEVDLSTITETSVVYHQNYGKGVVSKIKGEKIYVEFNGKPYIFNYPDAFEKGYLSYNG